MGKSLLILVLILHTSLFSGAQFVEVGGGIAGPVNNIYASTLLDKIVATGNFRMAGADSVNFIAAWDGLNWDNLGNGASEFGYAMNTAIDFESKLIINADFQLGYDTCWLYMWNGNSWNCQDSAAPNSRLMGLTIIEDTLYACGWMDSIGSTPVTGLARWDGNTWSGYQFPLAFWGMVDAIKYNGELIVGGNFAKIARGDTAEGITGNNRIGFDTRGLRVRTCLDKRSARQEQTENGQHGKRRKYKFVHK